MSPTPTTYPGGSICIVGAGMAGLCAAIQLKRQLGLTSFTVYERAADVGGVWLANAYPGCETDAPALAYTYSFATRVGWSQICPNRDEMLAYLQSMATKYEIYGHTVFNTAVKSAGWNDASRTWNVTTINVSTGEERVREFSIVILGTGPLREPFYPPEFASFSGAVMHSAAWDSNFALDCRIVGVVGSSSSAAQIIPVIAQRVGRLLVYIREPNHVFPKWQGRLRPCTRRLFEACPWLLAPVRLFGALVGDPLLASAYDAGGVLNRAAHIVEEWFLRRHVRDAQTRESLTPRYQGGYKVPVPVLAAYPQAYNRPNVKLVRSPVTKVEGHELTTADGQTQKLDVLILCTGFRILDFFAPLQVIGVDGVDLLALWKTTRPVTFYGVTCREAPNLFFLMGPNGGLGHGSAVFMIECQVKFVVDALRQLMKVNAVSIRVTARAQEESMDEIMEAARKKVYMKPVPEGVSRSWLVTENGHPVLWPKSAICYWLRTRRVVRSKFEFVCRKSDADQSMNYL